MVEPIIYIDSAVWYSNQCKISCPTAANERVATASTFTEFEQRRIGCFFIIVTILVVYTIALGGFCRSIVTVSS
jgi:hypothetical protein